MKNGWIDPPSGPWSVNSSGIIVAGNETYIISVYTDHQPYSEFTNPVKISKVCGDVAKLMV